MILSFLSTDCYLKQSVCKTFFSKPREQNGLRVNCCEEVLSRVVVVWQENGKITVVILVIIGDRKGRSWPDLLSILSVKSLFPYN